VELAQSRGRAARQTGYQPVSVFGAVDPLTGQSSALIAPTGNTHLMSEHLRMTAEQAGPDTRMVLVLDGAVWQWLRDHDLSNLVFEDQAAIDRACRESWNKLTPDRLMSITATRWITHERSMGLV